MIIARIGHQEYQLENIKDAETLLDILNRATPIDSKYIAGQPTLYVVEENRSSIAIEVTSHRLTSRGEYDALKAEADSKAAALKEAA